MFMDSDFDTYAHLTSGTQWKTSINWSLIARHALLFALAYEENLLLFLIILFSSFFVAKRAKERGTNDKRRQKINIIIKHGMLSSQLKTCSVFFFSQILRLRAHRFCAYSSSWLSRCRSRGLRLAVIPFCVPTIAQRITNSAMHFDVKCWKYLPREYLPNSIIQNDRLVRFESASASWWWRRAYSQRWHHAQENGSDFLWLSSSTTGAYFNTDLSQFSLAFARLVGVWCSCERRWWKIVS